nr:restriction endonuclease subunit S [Solimonas terrae]
MRFAAQINPTKSEIAHEPRDAEVSFLPMEAVGDDGSLNLERTRPIGEVETGYTYFREGDVTVAKITPCFENGKGAVMRGLVGGFGFGTTELTVARPRVGLTSSEYLHWLFSSSPFRSLGEASMYGAGGQKRVPEDFFRDFAIGLPALAEQTAIAAFLDRETAKIDALVAEQEKLIALLKEKRQAVISHAVTKGLNPDAPMKPSGIEWLGAVPAHWAIMRLKRDLAFITSGSRGWAEYYADDGELFIRIGNLTRETLELDRSDIQRVSAPAGAEGERTVVAPGDLLFSITAYLGSVAVAPEGMEKAYVSQHVALARLTGAKLLPRWVGYIVLSAVGKTYLDEQAYGGTKIQLGLDDVANMTCIVPPLEEQKQIATALDKLTSEVDSLLAEAECAITLLKERRAALISAAVTGQIDVRGIAT